MTLSQRSGSVSIIWLCLLGLLAACGVMAPMPDAPREQSQAPRIGEWSLEYRGGCTGREAEKLQITGLDENEIAFDDFRLLRNEAGEFVGSATFFAPMPVDGRNIPYEIAYTLRASDEGMFVGTETITEGGGHSLDCPVALVAASDR